MPKLMIVDDEDDVREFAANFFRKRKIDVVTAESGEDALRKLEKEKPTLVLLDIQMAGLDGIQTLESIKKKNKDIKVVMVTGRSPSENNTLEKCKSLGAMDYIHKPLRLDELERVVLSALTS
ncbi:MAG: response regulator [Candidatus Omnitrophica bacterium]|nr:response regulator [Candidatus Omnitrophota bacterium]